MKNKKEYGNKQKKVNNGYFVIDLQKFFETCTMSKAKQQETFNQKEISDSYEINDDNKLTLQQKVVHEVITPTDGAIDPEKYEVLKMLLGVVLSEDSDNFLNTSVSYSLAFNTFLNEGIIKIKE